MGRAFLQVLAGFIPHSCVETTEQSPTMAVYRHISNSFICFWTRFGILTKIAIVVLCFFLKMLHGIIMICRDLLVFGLLPLPSFLDYVMYFQFFSDGFSVSHCDCFAMFHNV